MYLAETVQFILNQKLIAIVRADTDGGKLAWAFEAIAKGGIPCIEVTMTTPGALTCLQQTTACLGENNILLGAGSVLDAETCRMAILAGARFIVTPVLKPDVIRMARRYGAAVCCGAYTPTEILEAWEQGADLVKVFPASVGGPEYIRALRAPLPQIPLVPVGGVTPDNLGAYLKAGAVAVGVGGGLVNRTRIEKEDYDGITTGARAFVDAVNALN